MNEDPNFIVLGCFGRVHGIKGFINVHSYTKPENNILNYKSWFYLVDKHWQPLKIAQLETSDIRILARVEGLDVREEVAKLTNVLIGVPRDQLPDLDDGEFYWHDLIGMTVSNQQGTEFGKVIDLLATGSNDVLVVEEETPIPGNDKRQLLIPYLPDAVLAVNKSERRISVDWDWDY